MAVTTLTREFIVRDNGNDVTMEDPNPNWTPEQVKDFVANQYPEIMNSEWSGPDHKDDKLVYTISNKYGTKG